MPARTSEYISPPPFGPSSRNDPVPERHGPNRTQVRPPNGKLHASKVPNGKMTPKLANGKTLHAMEKPSPSIHVAPSPTLPITLQESVLPPVTGRDVVALIFVSLLLPQGISCILLLGYILLESFRGLVARFLARVSVLMGYRQGPLWQPASKNTESTNDGRQRYWGYNRKVVGELLQLFSINSLVLLICHYTMPKLWTHYLLVLAKLIVASRLVGTYTVGTTTHVSVVSGGTTTSTTSSNALPAIGTWNSGTMDKPKYLKSNFFNSVFGFASVTATDYLIRHWLQHINVPQLVGDLARFYRGVWHLGFSSSSSDNANASDYLKVFFTKSPFIVTYNYLTKRKDRYYSMDLNKPAGMRLSIFDRLLLPVAARIFNLSESSLHTISSVLQEINTFINYAYLVLCIHVISLTISPFLKRFLIFKDYSRNLDHWSSLTPNVPLSGERATPASINLLHSDSMMVVNVDQPSISVATQRGPLAVNVESEIAISKVDRYSSKADIDATNFELFCLVPPTSKVPSPNNKTQQNRTLVERKRASSNAAPNHSTTIVDRYFTISIQPLWTWLAAIKVFFVNSSFFNGQLTARKECGSAFLDKHHTNSQKMSISRIGDRDVILECNEQYFTPLTEIRILVNSIAWNLVSYFTHTTAEGKREYVRVEGLHPLRQYEICCFGKHSKMLASVTVSTVDSGSNANLDHSIEITSLETLQGSLRSAINELNEVRSHHKKLRKDENKKIADLKKQVDGMKGRVEKVHNKVSVEGRGSGKVKGLQYSVIQLEHEVEDLQRQLDNMKVKTESASDDLRMEEQSMLDEIDSLEKFIEDYERNTSQLKNDVRAVETERNTIEVKLRKLQSKAASRKEEISRLNGDLKAMKKAILSRYQRRQKRVQERFETILPKVELACEELVQELDESEAAK